MISELTLLKMFVRKEYIGRRCDNLPHYTLYNRDFFDFQRYRYGNLVYFKKSDLDKLFKKK